jgi:hypothetical protein
LLNQLTKSSQLTGAVRYVDDITLEGMLFGKTVRSRIPRGRIKGEPSVIRLYASNKISSQFAEG